MKIALLLSKSDTTMSKAEAIESCKIYFTIESLEEINNLLVIELKTKKENKKNQGQESTKQKSAKQENKKQENKKTEESELPETLNLAKIWLNRLALTKEAHIIIETQTIDSNLTNNLVNNNPDPTFKISIRNIYISEGTSEKFKLEDFAKMLANNNFHKTKMRNPDLEFVILNAGKTFLGIKLWENRDPFEERKAHLRPVLHPTAINPRLARAMINLAGAEKEILDPFCGMGGILLEASRINLNATGIDISPSMISRAKLNLQNEKNIYLHEMDALKWTKPVGCIITDLPYGKSSKLDQSISKLAENFLSHYASLTKKIVFCTPNTAVIHIPDEWTLLYEFKIYIHKSLTRKIIVLSKN